MIFSFLCIFMQSCKDYTKNALQEILIWKPDLENITYPFQWLAILWSYENILPIIISTID